MSNERKYTPSDDEYQFPHEEHVHFETQADDEHVAEEHDDTAAKSNTDAEQQQPELAQTSWFARLTERFPNWQRPVLIAGGVFVLLIIIVIWHHKAANSDLAKFKGKREVPTLQSQLQSSMSATKQALTQQLSTLDQQVNNQQSSINDLKQQLSQLNDQTSDLHSATQRIADVLGQLNFQIKQLSETIKQQAVTKKSHGRTVKTLPKPVTYTVKAVIPGRAWLSGSDQSTTTVRVGDTVKNYGQVQAIDADNGRILTSSGKVITYGEDDN